MAMTHNGAFKKVKSGNFEDILVIERGIPWQRLLRDEVLHYREVLYFLTWSHIKARYKQTAIGIAWVILKPVAAMAIFSFLFGRLAKISSGNIPYPVFVYAGLLPWLCFAHSVQLSMNSVTKNADLIKRVYFPRMFLPVSATISAFADFFVSFFIFAILMAYYGQVPSYNVFFFPYFVLLLFLFNAGIGMTLSAINVMYRDVELIVPFFLQIGIFVTPVIYPVSIIPREWGWVIYFNPLTGLIEGFRATLFGGHLSAQGVLVSTLLCFGIFTAGLLFFIKTGENSIDVH